MYLMDELGLLYGLVQVNGLSASAHPWALALSGWYPFPAADARQRTRRYGNAAMQFASNASLR
jgi:hypothetical protein